MIALTSLSPAPERCDVQRAAVASWRAAGLEVRSLNHPVEIERLVGQYDVEYVPCAHTAYERCGRRYVTINALHNHLAAVPGQSVLINSDSVLRLTPEQLRGFAQRCRGGLGYLVNWNHYGDEAVATREPYGLGVFLYDAHEVQLEASSLCLGQPSWDYWLPYLYLRAERRLWTTDDRVVFHHQHQRTWDINVWDACAAEFCRCTRLVATSAEQRLALFQALYDEIDMAERVKVLG